MDEKQIEKLRIELRQDPDKWFPVKDGELTGNLITIREAMRKRNEATNALCNLALKGLRAEGVVEAVKKMDEDGNLGLEETEYAGRTETICKYCNYQEGVRDQHREDCPVLEVRAALQAHGGK